MPFVNGKCISSYDYKQVLEGSILYNWPYKAQLLFGCFVLVWCLLCCFFFKPTWHLQYSLHLIQPSLQILLQIYQECSFHHLLERGKSHTRVTILLFLLMTCFLISVRDHSCSSVLCIPCQAIHIHSSFNLISQNNPCSSSEFFFLPFSHQLVSCRKHFRIEHYIVAMLRWENIQCSLFFTSHIN